MEDRMTTCIARVMMTLTTVLIATAASAQVTVKPVRAARVAPPAPVLAASQRRLPTTTLRPTVTTPASDTYRNTRAVQSDLASQQRPSLGALAKAVGRPPKPQSAPVTVQPTVTIRPQTPR
jgi:hypothetical protein